MSDFSVAVANVFHRASWLVHATALVWALILLVLLMES